MLQRAATALYSAQRHGQDNRPHVVLRYPREPSTTTTIYLASRLFIVVVYFAIRREKREASTTARCADVNTRILFLRHNTKHSQERGNTNTVRSSVHIVVPTNGSILTSEYTRLFQRNHIAHLLGTLLPPSRLTAFLPPPEGSASDIVVGILCFHCGVQENQRTHAPGFTKPMVGCDGAFL